MTRRISEFPPLFLILIVTLFVASANPVRAQMARIQNGLGEWGYGWMFRYGGSCYVALPAHVAGPLPKVTVSTAAPVASDQATVRKPFWSDLDLAVAIIDPGPLEGRCTATLADLKQTPHSRTATQALLTRVQPLGGEERLPLRILDRSYLSFAAEVVNSTDSISQGTSGAFAFVGATPVGMAITSDDPSRAMFLRSEEIEMNLTRYLNEQGAAFRTTPQNIAPEHDNAPGFALVETSTNSPPTLPQFGVDNLVGPGYYVTRPSAPIEITLRLDGAAPKGVGRLQLNAPIGEYAVPRDIAVFIDSSVKGDRFRFWTQGRMTLDGIFDTGPLAPRNARWVRILVRNAWSEGDVALDQVIVE